MKIKAKDLIDTLAQAAVKAVSSEQARYFALETVETHLRKSPRTNPLEAAVADLAATLKYSVNKLDYKTDLDSFISIDFNRAGPLVFIKQIHDELEKRSLKNGLAMAAFTNSQSMHTLHAWVQGLAKRGLLAIAACNGGPSAVIPFGGTRGVLGTNPIAYGVPGSDGEILCVDMATSQIPFFEFRSALKTGAPLPDHSAVNNQGQYTTNARKAADTTTDPHDPLTNIVPLGGGYKGYYIVYLMEILTSALIGMPSSPEMSSNFVPEEHGAILLAFNPKVMGTETAFKKSVGNINQSIKSQESKKGESIRIPGEGNSRRYKLSRDQDITVDDELIKRIKNLAR